MWAGALPLSLFFSINSFLSYHRTKFCRSRRDLSNYLAVFYRWRNWDSERESNWHKVTQVISRHISTLWPALHFSHMLGSHIVSTIITFISTNLFQKAKIVSLKILFLTQLKFSWDFTRYLLNCPSLPSSDPSFKNLDREYNNSFILSLIESR